MLDDVDENFSMFSDSSSFSNPIEMSPDAPRSADPSQSTAQLDILCPATSDLALNEMLSKYAEQI